MSKNFSIAVHNTWEVDDFTRSSYGYRLSLAGPYQSKDEAAKYCEEQNGKYAVISDNGLVQQNFKYRRSLSVTVYILNQKMQLKFLGGWK